MTKGIPHASAGENLQFSTLYTATSLLRGIFILTPFWTSVTTKFDTHRKAADLITKMRVRYGGRSVWVKGLSGKMLLVLSQGDVKRVLDGSDEVFSLANPQKVAGIKQFQPDSLIVSQGELRRDRRRFNDAVLTFDPLKDRFRAVAHEEIEALLSELDGTVMTKEDAFRAFRRIARRCLFGDSAREDDAITEMLLALRRNANWLGRKPWTKDKAAQLYDRLAARIAKYASAAEPGSLMSRFPEAPTTPQTNPVGQVTHWMMAFDVTSLGILHALALLAVHPEHRARAMGDEDHLRACFWEALRLWALVPSLTRVTTEPVDWDGEIVPAGVEILIPSVILHRNPQLEYADRFTPEVWLDGRGQRDWWIHPFAKGPGECPGKGLGLFLGPAILEAFLQRRDYELLEPVLDADRPLPYMFDSSKTSFAVSKPTTRAPSPDSESPSGRKSA
ncbi:cytochrome P450 [Rhizohabitans arisaemae]|uniref:cytochrome P450 n=1 Tax=Rhizohabitans arisaemae TaxID=2720610 RepID=UPI0024B04EBB|nr:cytochrome P450 [Rhizohabitans arisaemae]